jgi:hypothetical protein
MEIGSTILWLAEQPPHVCVNEISSARPELRARVNRRALGILSVVGRRLRSVI